MFEPRLTLVDEVRRRYHRLAAIPVEHDVRPYFERLRAIDAVRLAHLSDEILRGRASHVRQRARSGDQLDALLPEVFALAREAAGRTIGLRHFDVQLATGIALHEGKLAQLATGEGKTLAAVPPAILNALSGRGVHVFTANDYLAERDARWMAPVYRLFGLEVAAAAKGMSPAERRSAYNADVTYVTAKEAGFDLLRDQTAESIDRHVHRAFHYVIVDEADFILIDEARVPLVIAGPAPATATDARRLADVAQALEPGVDYDSDEYGRTVAITERGLEHAGALLGGVDLQDAGTHHLLSGLHVALHAQVLLRRDRDYIVRYGRVELVDEWTGRVAPDRRWPHGIQSAVEAKEGVEIRPEGRVLGSIPVQHFVSLYPKIAGMTATAETSADEFRQFYGLTTAVFPPHLPCRRIDEPDLVFTHRAAKTTALASEIVRVNATGRPVLVGTASVRESEELAATLRPRGVKCRVLNARHDAREAQIVARAGALGAVTISTNMAGRGTDIVPGGGDEGMRDRVLALGGLYVIGTNRHESRRIDDQLRGRAGRQGDPGSSRFFVSLEDDLIERYGVLSLIPRRHRPSRRDSPVLDRVVLREIDRAQRIVEGQNFDIRKTLWQYSRLIEEQRRILQRWRTSVLTDAADSVCAVRLPERYAAMVGRVGEAEVRRAERLLTLRLLDQAWADHLALVEDIREGIHWQRYGGREPIAEFHREVVAAFDAMGERVREETVAAFARLDVEDGRLDVTRLGIAGPSSTWTYLVNDNPFSSLGVSLMASRHLGLTGGVGVLAMVYWPVTALVAAAVFMRRWLRRRRRESHDSR